MHMVRLGEAARITGIPYKVFKRKVESGEFPSIEVGIDRKLSLIDLDLLNEVLREKQLNDMKRKAEATA